MRINTNVPALSSYNALTNTNSALSKSIHRLSTGLRINSAADDAAGLAISEKMRAQYRGLDKAASNAQDGISMIQTAEGAMNETHSILQRMRELSVQAANDTLTQEDRGYIQLEIDELKSEIDRISTTTQFNRKQLLDGSASALWSADTLGIGLKVKGALLSRDQFGQVVKPEGNYRVVVTAQEAGQGQVLKSNIFTHADPRPGSSAAKDSGGKVAGKTSRLSDLAQFVDGNGRMILDDPQTLTVSMDNGKSASITVYSNDTLGSLGEKINTALKDVSGTYEEGSLAQWVGKTSTVMYADAGTFGDDVTSQLTQKLLSGWLEAAVKKMTDALGGDFGDGTLTLKIEWGDLSDGTLGVTHMTRPPQDEILIELSKSAYNRDSLTDAQWEDLRTTVMHELTHAYQNNQYPGLANFITRNDGPIAGSAWIVEGLPEYVAGGNARVKASLGGMALDDIKKLMNEVFTDVPKTSAGYAASYLVTRFYDQETNGKLTDMLDKLKVASDTMTEAQLATLLDDAIATSGKWNNLAEFQAAIAGGDADAFITDVRDNEDPAVDNGTIGGRYASGGTATPTSKDPDGFDSLGYKTNPLEAFGVSAVELFGVVPENFTGGDHSPLAASEAKDGTLQSVAGTMLLHSNIAGSAGRISLSGSEDLIKALGFTEIQSSRDVKYSVSIYDAHSGETVASGALVTGNEIIGVLHENIDITMLDNYGLTVDGKGTLTDGYGTFKFGKGTSEFIVHVADNSTVLQVGANEGETFSLSFGDTSSRALGVDRVKVTDRESAARAITTIDGAISTVSMRRARLGAYQNRLEHTISNLTTSSTNLKSSESRIRDLDMAKEMMSFTKLNILSQAGNSMLSQANSMPQSVLSLLR